MTRLTVATVLRSGGGYSPVWVTRLKRQVAAYLPASHRFACLSDVEIPGVEVVPLRTDWPGWWAKLELWRPGTFPGRVLYFDLDTLITGDLAFLAGYAGHRAVLADFYTPAVAATGVMAWDGADTGNAWAHIGANANPERFVGRSDHFLRPIFRKADRLQALFPGMIGSYKAHHLQAGPKDFSVVCFHGKPRPPDLPADSWARRHWEGTA